MKRIALVKAFLALAIVAGGMQIGSFAKATFPGTNGLVAFVGGGNVFVVDPSLPLPVQVTTNGNFTRARFNATANKIVSDQAGGLVLLDPVAGSPAQLVPNTSAGDTRPAFNPDGTKLVFKREGVGLFTMGLDGSNRTLILSSAAATQPEWSADGSFIAYSEFPTSIRRISPTGGNLTVLATTGPGGTACAALTPCQTPTISPDSTKVAYDQQGTANGGLAQVNANGTSLSPNRLTTGANDSRASYAPDATKLVFARNQALTTVVSDGSGIISPLGINGVTWTHWGVRPAPVTQSIAYSVSGPVGQVKNGACVFTITASGPATGSVNYAAAVVNGKNSPSPASGAVVLNNQSTASQSIVVKHSRKQHGDVSLTLTSATGGSIGSPSTATCDVGQR